MNDLLEEIFKKIEDYFEKKENSLSEEYIWLLYRFLDEESKRIQIDIEVSKYLCTEFNDFIQITFDNISQDKY